MKIFSIILVAIVAIEHIYILYIEMFAWTTMGRKIFRSIPPDLFEKTKTFAANQGLYNGFLSVGLIWSLFIQNGEWSRNVAMFFLICVIVAGIYGGVTVTCSIFIKQAIPAIIALIIVLFKF